jgi:hypothetical protein
MASIGLPPHIARLTYPTIVGTLLDYFLLGTLTLQTYIHYYSFPDEKLPIKLLIYSLLVIETVQVCCAAANIYYWFGAGYGDFPQLNAARLSPLVTLLLGSVVAFIVQIFFCYMIWSLRRNDFYIVICVMIGTISVLQFAAGMGGGVNGYVNKFFSVVSASSTDGLFTYMWLIGDAVAGVLITVTLIYLFNANKSDLQTQPRGAFNRVIGLIIRSNALTTTVVIITLALYATIPASTYFMTPILIIGKLYSNTLLANINHPIFHKQSTDSRSNYSSGRRSSLSGTRFTSRPPVPEALFRSRLSPSSACTDFLIYYVNPITLLRHATK